MTARLTGKMLRLHNHNDLQISSWDSVVSHQRLPGSCRSATADMTPCYKRCFLLMLVTVKKLNKQILCMIDSSTSGTAAAQHLSYRAVVAAEFCAVLASKPNKCCCLWSRRNCLHPGSNEVRNAQQHNTTLWCYLTTWCTLSQHDLQPTSITRAMCWAL